MNLAIYNHGIDDVAAVINGYETSDLYFACAPINIHYADIGAKGEGEIGWIVVVDRLQSSLHTLRKVCVSGKGHLLHGNRFARRTFYTKLTAFLARRGFNYDTARTAIERLLEELAENGGAIPFQEGEDDADLY